MSRQGEFRCGACDVLLLGWKGNLTLGASEVRLDCPKCGEERVFYATPSPGTAGEKIGPGLGRRFVVPVRAARKA